MQVMAGNGGGMVRGTCAGNGEGMVRGTCANNGEGDMCR